MAAELLPEGNMFTCGPPVTTSWKFMPDLEDALDSKINMFVPEYSAQSGASLCNRGGGPIAGLRSGKPLIRMALQGKSIKIFAITADPPELASP